MTEAWPKFPNIYEINTRLWLKELSLKYGKTVLLGSVPDEEILYLKNIGFDCIWLMGIWMPSPLGQDIARSLPNMRKEFERALPNLKEEDIIASPYAIKDYSVNQALGGEKGLCDFRNKLKRNNLKLILDFVPNHLAIDHSWVRSNPELFVRGTQEDFERDPGTYFRVSIKNQDVKENLINKQSEEDQSEGPSFIIAHGKDPYYPAWSDTAQLNYFHPDLRRKMTDIIEYIASICDGIRCDMAMLILNNIHYGIWGDHLYIDNSNKKPPQEEFWKTAIKEIKENHPDFLFIAEAYWMREGELQLLGFDYTYDKALYDWLRNYEPSKIKSYIHGPFFYQEKCVRFIENHDEERARSVFTDEEERCAALIAATLPGARLFYEGQMEGNRVRCPVQLGRRIRETVDGELKDYYEKLLKITKLDVFHKGEWFPLLPYSAWDGNISHNNFIIYLWRYEDNNYLIVVNLSPYRSQCYVPLPKEGIEGKICHLEDMLDENYYERDGDLLTSFGLYLDMRGFYRHLFRIRLTPKTE